MDDSYSVFISLLVICFAIACVVAMWKVYTKAGQPGWGVLIPFYSNYLLVKIAGRPGWWFLLYFVPIVNLVITFIVCESLARRFNRSSAFGIFLLALFPIGYLILGFSKDTYTPVGSQSEVSTQSASQNPI